MNGYVLLFVLRDLVNHLEGTGVLKTDGSLTIDFGNLTTDLNIAGVVETSLKSHGVTVPSQIEKVVAAIPLLEAILQ